MQLNWTTISVFLWTFLGYTQAFTQDPIPIAGSINTDKIEYAPSISADGNHLVFQSNIEGRYKLYISEKKADGTWMKPLSIEGVNNIAGETDLIGGPSISYDGNEIYFFGTIGGKDEDLFKTVKEGDHWSEPIRLGDGVNTKGYEAFPSISPDGKKLFFTRIANNQVYEFKVCYQLFISEKGADGKWQTAKPLPRPINRGCEKCPRIMSDNETLIYSAVRGESTKKSNYDFFQSRLMKDGRWSKPVALNFINSDNDDVFCSVPSQGDIAYLNVNKDIENQDIYTIPIPEELRPRTVINIAGKITSKSTNNPLEASLIILQDGDTMNTGGLKSNPFDGNYTAVLTEGHHYELIAVAPGYKADRHSYDLKSIEKYRLEKLDIALSAFQRKLELSFYSMETNDILEADVLVNNNPISPTDSGTYILELDAGKKYNILASNTAYEPFVTSVELDGVQFKDYVRRKVGLKPSKPTLEMVVTAQDTKKPLKSKLLLFDDKSKKMLFSGELENGKYLGDLNFDRRFLYRVTRDGFFYKQGIIDLHGVMEGKEVKEFIELAPLKVGSKLILNNITFEFGSAELTNESKVELNNVFYILSKHKEVVLEIAAHTDDVGSHDDNVELSEERAHAVRDYLASKGISQELLSYHGYGETKPLVANNSDENRALNRRVEFIVKEVKE